MRSRAWVVTLALLAGLALACDGAEGGDGGSGHGDRPLANPDPAPGRPRGADPTGKGITSTTGDSVTVQFRGLWSGRLFGVKGAWNYGTGNQKIAVNDPPWQQERKLNRGQQVSMTLSRWDQQGFPRKGSISCRIRVNETGFQIDFDSNEDNNLEGGVTCSGEVP